jgi:NADP-dependent aldehyde dehydrogenase
MTDVVSIDPRTASRIATVARESTEADVDLVCRRAEQAAPALEAMGREGRARLLRAMADALEGDRAAIVATADRETALGAGRLGGELTRTCYQLRQFAQVLLEGSYLQASIDHAADTPMGPRPDLRRMLLPIGPVGVFAASNFPLAFSVPGGDTAAAVAAGCPVVVKAHPGHPATSLRCLAALAEACRGVGAPEGTVALIFGQEAGLALVRHPAIRAIGFTGSERGGRALQDVANSRPDPIPFYGELGSLNPLVITAAAAAERAGEIATGLAASITNGAGQFCTKPGLVLVRDDEPGRTLVRQLAEAVGAVSPAPLLTEGIAQAFDAGVRKLAGRPTVTPLTAPGGTDLTGYQAFPALISVTARDLDAELLAECFGPLAVIAFYGDDEELLAVLGRLPGSLTGTIHRGRTETDLPVRLERVLSRRVGRLLFDGYPTGVAVAWSMQHGGPWPSTTSPLHTSVGMTSIGRFLRPVTWQNAPEALLPAELREAGASIPRRLDGRLVLPPDTTQTAAL